MKPLQNLLLLLILSFLCSSSCKKDYEPPFSELHPEFKEWAYFKTESWWAYQKSGNNDLTIDTVKVITDSVTIYDLSEHREDKVLRRIEAFGFETISTASGKVINYNGSSVCGSNPDSTQACFLAQNQLSDNSYGSSYYFFYPIIKGTAKPDYGNHARATLEKIMDSLKVRERWFYNVVVIHDDFNPVETGYETRFYHAKNIGIIRKEINKTTTGADNWVRLDLIDYDVVQ